jgi:flagellar basal-body rod protein FlgB
MAPVMDNGGSRRRLRAEYTTRTLHWNKTMATELDTHLQFHAQALNLRAMRQQLLASNIANADTPGYKARDIDFAAALREADAGRAVSTVSLRASNEKHLPGSASDAPATALYRSAQQPSIDGNTVDMDVERNRFAENAVHYDANLTFLTSQIKLMLAALQG